MTILTPSTPYPTMTPRAPNSYVPVVPRTSVPTMNPAYFPVRPVNTGMDVGVQLAERGRGMDNAAYRSAIARQSFGRDYRINAAALGSLSVADQMRELRNLAAADEFAGRYVDRIKEMVRYPYEYSTAAEAQQAAMVKYKSPGVMATRYSYPSQNMRRGAAISGW